MTIVHLKQRDLFTRRWRNVEQIDPSETGLQIALVARLHKGLRTQGVIWFHVPNGEHRDKRTAAKLKAMGVLPGVADLVFDWNGRMLYLELKRVGGVMSASQKEFKERAERAGRLYAVAYSVDEAVGILRGFGMEVL